VLLLTGLLLAATPGCSSFERSWRSAASMPVSAHSLAGRWEGSWRSDVNGHEGRLRCLITPKDQEGDVFEARFHATYLKVLRFGYTVPLTARFTNEAWHFQGEADLGKMAGGVFHYAGTATNQRFYSTYRSRSDHGTFEMQRPARDVATLQKP
jgi:hypothetical protein